jgi:aspartyl-tRNA(Asn)/glutamyl-tRNA(Gln) amidotransferase subunit C
MDRDTVRELAAASRLDLTDSEQERAEQQLGRILAFFRALEAVDTSDVEPSPYPRPIPHRARPDEPGEVLSQDDVLSGAPATRGGRFLVPRVFDL